MEDLVAEERVGLEVGKAELVSRVVETLVPPEAVDNNDIILEVHAGVGGSEAGLFAYELFNMYQR